MPREYRKSKRAEKEEATRQRIVEAAVELHQAVGNDGATWTAIAERAGVGRVTVYRHFPDERTLFSACTGHYFAQNPPPDPRPWAEIADPDERTRTALAALYAFYGRTEKIMWRSEHDAPSSPILTELMQPFFQYLAGIRDMLMAGRANADDPRARAAAGHAVAFSTWYSLARDQSLCDDDVIALMLRLLAGPCAD